MWRHQTSCDPRRCSLGRMCCAVSALVVPFHRKWRHQASRNPQGVPLEGWGGRKRNRKLRNIHPIEAVSAKVTLSYVTWPRRSSLGRVGCANAQSEIGDFSLLESLLTGNDAMQLLFFVCSTFHRCSTHKSYGYAWELYLVVMMVGDIFQFMICVAHFLISHVRFYPLFTLLLDMTLPLLFFRICLQNLENITWSWQHVECTCMIALIYQ